MILIDKVSYFFFFSSRRRHTRFSRDWSSDVCSSDLCVDTVDGTAHANSSTATRMIRAHRDTRFSNSAMPMPRSRLSATFTAVNVTVRSSTVQNVESERMFVKLRSPTNAVVPLLWNSAYLPDSCFCKDKVMSL